MTRPFQCHGVFYISVVLKQLNYKAGEDVTDVDNEVMESMENRSVLMPHSKPEWGDRLKSHD